MGETDLQQEEHEAFRNRLVDDVLGPSAGDKVPMEKVVMLIWQFRDDPSVVTFMARFVQKYAGSRHVFDGIEFYLPQLAHMIIHLEADWDDAILERFALVIAQQSLHFALQLNWILQGALQDYQPELADGAPNSNYNPTYYSRCLKLLKNVERCVVYGKPRAAELQRLYEQGKITKSEMIAMEQADRRFNALQITADDSDDIWSNAEKLDGWLYVQMPVTAAIDHSSRGGGHNATAAAAAVPPEDFKSRFCVLDRHVLNCYKPKGGCASGTVLDRAMSLERASFTEEGKMVIVIQTRSYKFKVRCGSEEELKLWMRRMTEEADTTALFQHHNASQRESKLKQDLTPEQLNRYEFFQNERNFVMALTDVAEALREKDRAERKALAPGLLQEVVIPDPVYMPLCNSSDIWRRVFMALPKETRVFNTKERCPVIMNFVSKRGELTQKGGAIDPNLDVAEYMHSCFEVGFTGMEDVVEGEDEDATEEHNQENGSKGIELRMSEHGTGLSQVWQEEEDHQEPATPPARETKPKGNTKVQKLLRESFVTLPSMLAKRMTPGKHEKRISVMDRQTEMQPLVPILEGNRAGEEADNASVGDGTVVSVEKSSILVRDQILLGSLDEGGIDLECIDRAKQFVCGGESWAEKSARMLKVAREEAEKEGEHVTLEIAACLAKSNDDLRQEVFVMQMIHYYKSVFAQAKLPLWLKTYRILSTSSSTGLLEVLTDATSLDGLKKMEGYPPEGGLRKYFEIVYDGPKSASFKQAQTNFMHSLAGYALVSYLLGLKDRHNGNIMIDTRGHLVFIDFGFAMGMAPGHEFSFERAPFKLTKEMVEVMDGVGSDCYREFQRLFVAGFEEARKNSQIALGLVEIMMYKSNYPCFSGSRYGKGRALTRFEKRLMLKVPDNRVKRKALHLISQSKQHFGTYLYDVFQKATNGYAI